MTDFEETLLESEHSEADFREIAVELDQGPVDYTSHSASSTSFPLLQPSNKTASDNVKLAQTLSETENLHCETEIPIPEAKAKSMCELPSNQRPSEEYMKQHVEEISAKFYRALFGEDYVEATTLGKDVNIVTESFKPSEYERFTVNKLDAAEASNIDQVAFELSSEVNKKSTLPSLETTNTNISKKDLQIIKTVCGSPPKQLLTSHEGEIVASDDSTLTQMSLVSATGQTNSLSNPIMDEPEFLKFTTEFEVHIPESSGTSSHYESSVLSIPVSDYRSFLQAELISPTEHRSSSPVSVFEYDTELELCMQEYRSLSPQSTVSLPPDSPISYEYRSGSLDSCVLIDTFRACSGESIASSTEQKLYPDSPIPDFRPHSPECEYTAPMQVDTPRISNQLCFFEMHESNMELSSQKSFLMDSDEIYRPVSPGSWIECRSFTPESNGSFPPGSFTTDKLDRDLSPEIPQDSEQCSWTSDICVDRASGPGSTESLNEYMSLSCDSPIQSFTPEVYDYFKQVKGSISSSPQSAVSDLGYELSEWLFEDRPLSPESAVSVNECRCLSPDLPLPSFVQNLNEFTSIKECRFSDECQHFSPESLSSVKEHIPLSPESTLSSFSLPICTVNTSLGYHSESLESDLSDRVHKLVSPTPLLENQPSIPDSTSSLNISDSTKAVSKQTAHMEFEKELTSSEYTFENITKSQSLQLSAKVNGKKCRKIKKLSKNVTQVKSLQLPEQLESSLTYRLCSPIDCKLTENIQNLTTDSCDSGSNQQAKTIRLFEARPSVIGNTQNPFYNVTMLTKVSEVAATKRKSHNLISKVHDPQYKGPNTTHFDYSVKTDENTPLSPDSPIQQSRQFFPESGLSVCGPSLPKPVWSNSNENESVAMGLFVIEQKTESTNSFQSEFETRPLSPDSIPEYRPMSPESMILALDIKQSSPDPFSPCRPLSPDSPIPQYSEMYFKLVPVTTSRSSSLESLASSTDYDLNILSSINSDCRSSPKSVASSVANECLPPDSPIPDFRCLLPEQAFSGFGYRSCSPESACSNSVELETFPRDMFIVAQRPESPDSFQSEFEARPLSPYSIPEYRPMSPESMNLASHIRGSSLDSFSASRPQSSDSPIPQYSGLFCELMPTLEHRLSSPVSMASDNNYDEDDYELNAVNQTVSRASSLDLSTDENRPLSPDSPIQQFRPFFPEGSLPVYGYRSCSPESLCSNSIPEYRPMSPESMNLASDIRESSPDSFSACRPLSPDSPIPQYSGLFCELMPTLEHRLSSPVSMASDNNYDEDEDDYELNAVNQTVSRASSLDLSTDENRPLSPDSPIQQFRPFFPEGSLPVSGYRSCSSESLCSNPIENETFADRLFVTEQRPESPESFQSEFEARPLSTDSVPEYRPMSPESMNLASDFRGSSPDSISACRPLSPDSPIPQYSGLFCKLMPIIEHRLSSPVSMASDNNYDEDEDDYELHSVTQTVSRASSPDLSTDENRPLSPDSPIQQFRPFFPEGSLSVSGYRSCSPESLCSNSIPEYRPVSPQSMNLASDIRESSPDSFSACRPLSPDSPIPQYSGLFCELMPIIEHRLSSPMSMASDNNYDEDDYELNAVNQTVSRASSLALSTDENRPLSPDSPIQQFRPFFPEGSLPVYGYRSCSPESLCSNSIPEYRPMSPESMKASDIRESSPDSFSACRPLSPDSPIPQYSGLFCELMPTLEHRLSSPVSMASDNNYDEDEDDYELNAVNQTVSRASSLDLSTDENRPLSPDSPIQQFRPFFPEGSLPVSGYRSCSPESLCSNSIPEYRRMSPESMNLASDIRESSPDSFSAFRLLSPDSPIPQYSGLFCDLMPIIEHRLSSSVSMASYNNYDEDDYELNAVNQTVSRASSLDLSTDENRPLSPDSPIQQFRPFFPEGSLPVYGYRSCSPESLCSNSIPEYRPMSPESMNLASDIRESSPDSFSACRPLSPDSPIPQYSGLFCELMPTLEHRLSSPVSMASDNNYDEDEDDYELNAVNQTVSRASSLDLSTDENRPLSPDSPIQQFRPFFPEGSLPVSGYRSCSSESLCSNPIENETFADRLFVTEQRPESPESFQSEFEARPLSTDSVPEYRPMSPESMNLASDFRGSSPDSISACRPLSPDSPIPQYSGLFCKLMPIIEHRLFSPVSMASDNNYDEDEDDYELHSVTQTVSRASSPDLSTDENRPLSPDSPIQQFRPFFPEGSLSVSGYRSCSPESLCSNSIPEYRPVSPQSMNLASDIRESSPDSFSACRPLSPDSPIPQYSGLFCELMPIIEHRLSSPMSMASDNNYDEDDYELNAVNQTVSRASSLALSTDENRPLSPDSPIQQFRPFFPEGSLPVYGYRSCSPESLCSNSIPEYRPMSPESMKASDIRESSPDSFSACRPLSPDSPIPQYSGLFCELMPTLEHRLSSPVSMASDNNYDEDEDDYELNAVNQTVSRASSLDLSTDENRPLSPDSPIQQFRPFFPEGSLPVSGYRSCSPESLCSNSIPEYRRMSPESMNLASDIRESSPDSFSAFRLLSPDSPIPQYSGLFCDLMPIIEHRLSSSVSMASYNNYDEDDYELNAVNQTVSRASSLDLSTDENRPLSPDSPIQQFRPFFPEGSLPVSGYRSCSPESLCSNPIENETFADRLFVTEQRPESPDSFQPEFEARPLSTDSIPEYRPMSPESMNLASDFRGSSPDSISACRPLSPDSPIPQYSTMLVDLPLVTGCRSSSPESMASDKDYVVNFLSFIDSDLRPSSPDSGSIDENTRLSPDSPIQEFRPYFFESTLPGPAYTSCSLESICSNSIEYETKNVSPEYVMSVLNMRRVSLDSVNSSRQLSPESPTPQYSTMLAELQTVTGHRSPSSESMGSDEDYEFNVYSAAHSDDRHSLPDSIESVDVNTRLSPDSPIQAFTPSFSECALPISGFRSCSPESVDSNSIQYALFPGVDQRLVLTDSFIDNSVKSDSILRYRAMSLESAILQSDIRGSSPDSLCACRPLSPDSPIPQYSAMFCGLVPITGYRSSSLESLASGSDCESNILNFMTSDYRASPESLASLVHNEHIPQDSPVPDFGSPQCILTGFGYRSCSPDSIYSNSIENESLPGDLFTVEQRLESPDSFQSEFEARPLSPDSIPEYRPMSPEPMITASYVRVSSPDSFSECGRLSPDSAVPQYSELFYELIPVIGHRLFSPESMALYNNYEEDYDDYELHVLTGTVFRASSPDSMKSLDENRPLSPDSPIQQFSSFPEGSFPVFGYRSCSPESAGSISVENETFSGDLFIVEQRPVSPGSFQSEFEHKPLSPDTISEYRPMSAESLIVASHFRGASPESCRPLSLDSPVPQYSTMFADLVLVTGHRSSPPESMASDIDYEVNILSTEDSYYRLSSPDSKASIDEETRLSLDSPIQAYKPSFLESTFPVSGYRSCSPESICSNSIEYELFNMSPQSRISASEIRGSSPDSISAHRPLSPDSPIPQYSTMLDELVSVTGHGSSFPESVHSAEDDEFNVFNSVPFDYRIASPDSVVSADENRPLSPGSATSIPQFQETIKMVPEYKLVYKTIPLNLISNIHDPHYKGETFSSKTGVFEYIGCRMEIVQTCKMDESNGISNEGVYKIPALTHESAQNHMQSQTILTVPVLENQNTFSALSLNQSMKYNKESFEFPEENSADSITCYTPDGHECLEISDDLRASSPESIRSENEFRPFSPDSPIPEHMSLLPYTLISQYKGRPPSPESVSSVNEFQRLSPDSPIPEFSAHSPLPSEHNVQLSVTNLTHISPIMSDILSSEYASVWLETKQRPASPVYELSECRSRSISPPTFSFESTYRFPSPESLREFEPNAPITPDSLIFDIDCRPESPESVTSQTQCNDSMKDNQFVSEPEKEEMIIKPGESPPPVINKVIKMIADDGDGRNMLRIQEEDQRINVVKQDLVLQHKQSLEARYDRLTSEIGQQEFKTRALQDIVSEKDIQLKNQSREIKNKNIRVSEEDSSQVQNQSTSATILEQNAIGSSLTSEGNIQPGVSDPKSLDYIPEGRTVVSADLENVRPVISLKHSLEHPMESSGLCEIHMTSFHFNHQQSHRTVTPNLSISSSPSSDCRDVLSSSVRIPFVGSRVLPTDLGPVTTIFSKLCSNQELTTNSQLSNENNHFETFHHVVSEFEKPVSPLSTDDSDLVAGGICNMEIALAPTSFETSHSTDGSLMDVDLKKAKPRPVQSDSLESDNEFYDCQQTFSDVSEPELRSEDIFGPETLYHVEEFPSLPNTPAYDYLLVTSKITEKSEVDSQDSPCPVSWGSEEIDLPLVLEPEDECVDEHDEEVEYPYGYADEHSYAEELPPRQGGLYDEDDDSLGREIAAELGLLSDSSDEEVLTTRVVRRRVIIQGDELPEISPYKVTEEQYTDEHGNIVTKKITRKIIRKYVSADGIEREEVMQEGTQQEAITVDEADCFSKVLKRTVVKSAGDQTEVTFSEAAPVGKVTASGYEGESADGRKVSKVIKTMMVQGERMEKQIGDPSLSADLPSAKEDFETDPHA
ncbi:ankyrin-2b isoform X2 [Tachysurus fulvidraco]|uniref:ankyrin-2b isoform X2 n=1 Tax=Tachysurus fulvidraco TaxID=1234273 RepID=UPI001FEDFC03|nr:ankyrin-2b isoform X2 [Tachysurus fulvidraco]